MTETTFVRISTPEVAIEYKGSEEFVKSRLDDSPVLFDLLDKLQQSSNRVADEKKIEEEKQKKFEKLLENQLEDAVEYRRDAQEMMRQAVKLLMDSIELRTQAIRQLNT